MKLGLNTELCEGFGACARHLPEVFALDEWGYAELRAEGVVPHGKEHLARRAMDDCPVLAIVADVTEARA